ncbi:3-methyl-2-oxobutanoate hydroxymethyltransferase [Virgibacillus sp. W0430]|uniref:3-methyl-2-oxobutanoate hydroxymethyltransferase n=1 Tax=Virgibacillus sp. W0430 TaxID=3391580 RepID=UPI003F44D2F4
MLNRIELQRMKENKEKITMVTAYDYPSAKQVEAAGVDLILVGDSLGMVVLGYTSTVHVTLDDMIHHTKAVKRGAKKTFTVVDMPFMSYHISLEQSLMNATKLFQETGAEAIKLEGASEAVLTLTKRLTEGGIPVFAHLGLTPQTVHVLGGYKVQGKDKASAEKLLEDAKQLEKNGAIGLVLECVPKELAEIVTSSLSIPTIGIGAGLNCDGQVLVYHDILRYGTDRLPKFVKPYAHVDDVSTKALQSYVAEVKNETFPTADQTFFIKNKSDLPLTKSR